MSPGEAGCGSHLPDLATFKLSRREGERRAIMAGGARKELTLGASQRGAGLVLPADQAGLAAVSSPGRRRGWGRGGAASPSARRKPTAVRAAVLEMYAEERSADFGPARLAEPLARRKRDGDHEPVRRWLLAAGKWPVRRRRQKHRSWRERKACCGGRVPLDGAHHAGCAGRREPCVRRGMVDDATNRVWAQFFQAETPPASDAGFAGWVKKHRLPGGL